MKHTDWLKSRTDFEILEMITNYNELHYNSGTLPKLSMLKELTRLVSEDYNQDYNLTLGEKALTDEVMRRFMWKVNNSNIAYNKTTHQFGEIWWKTNGGGSKIGSCGVWPDEEYITLTIVEAKRLYEFDKPNSSWSSPSKECIKFVFGKEWNEIK